MLTPLPRTRQISTVHQAMTEVTKPRRGVEYAPYVALWPEPLSAGNIFDCVERGSSRQRVGGITD